MDKEFIILGNDFVKFRETADNEFVVDRIHEFEEGVLQGIVDRAIASGKVIFLYDRHQPKDIREIVGEVSNISITSDGIKASIKWNDLGRGILENESRYPSVELKVDENNEYILVAIAMVGEPASDSVDLLELSIYKEKDMEEIKAILQGTDDVEKAEKLTELLASNPEEVGAMLIQALIEGSQVEVESEVKEELDESEEKRHSEEGVGYREADRKDEDVKKKETPEARHEDEGTGLKDYEEEKKGEELSALAYEYGASTGLGTPTAMSLKKAKEAYIDLLKTRLPEAQKQEIAFKELKFAKHEEKLTDEELSAINNKEELSPEEAWTKQFIGR